MGGFTAAGPMPIEVYASTTSVVAGSSISFYVSATIYPAIATLQIFRSSQIGFADSQYGTIPAADLYINDYRPLITVGASESPCFEASVDLNSYPMPTLQMVNGYLTIPDCGWPIAATWNVPFNQPSSVYIAQVVCGTTISYTVFVVRAQTPGRLTKVVCQLPVNTYQAYNPWGGGDFYANAPPYNYCPTVSFARPCQLWDYILYDQPIVTWLEANFRLEFVTNVDLDADAGLLSSYQLFISTGHDEYWSENMRDQIEAFAQNGGNVLFLSGNTMYKPVTFSGRQQMARIPPGNGSWQEAGRPEALTTGENGSAGLWSQPLPAQGYLVVMPNHWIFDGTGLQAGDSLGSTAGVIGYETDAGVYNANGNPTSPSPSNLVTIASVDLTGIWTDPLPAATPGTDKAEITAYWRQQGYIMNVGSTGWGQGLREDGIGDPVVMQVTTNMVTRMQYRFGIIYTVDQTGNLNWYRDWNQDGTGDIGGPSPVGIGGWDTVQSLTGDETGVIYAVTVDGNLVWYRDYNRDGSRDVANGKVIGQGGWNQFQFVFSGGGGTIYAVSTDGNLHWYRDYNRDGTGNVVNGSVIGFGGWNTLQFVFSGGGGIIYAVSTDGNLYWYRDLNRDGTGNVGGPSVIGYGGWNSFVRVLADSTGNIYAITESGDLVAYKDYNRDGTGNVADGQTIGFGGWNSFLSVFSGS